MKNSNNFCLINKINNLPSDLDPYIERVIQFIGKVILLGNSLVLRIMNLFNNLNEEYRKDGMLGTKINLLERIGYKRLGLNETAFYDLLSSLRKFNNYLNLSKHSLFAASPELMKKNSLDISLGDVTTLKIQKFSEKEQEEIYSLGSRLNQEISEICKSINVKD